MDSVITKLQSSAPGYRSWADGRPGIYPEDEDLPYVQAANLALYLVESVAGQRHDELPRVFAMVEELLPQPDVETQDLVRAGFLEGIQNYSSSLGVDHDLFLPYLGLGAWRQLVQGWEDLRKDIRPLTN